MAAEGRRWWPLGHECPDQELIAGLVSQLDEGRGRRMSPGQGKAVLSSYRRRAGFFTRSEAALYRELQGVLPAGHVVFPKARLSDLVESPAMMNDNVRFSSSPSGCGPHGLDHCDLLIPHVSFALFCGRPGVPQRRHSFSGGSPLYVALPRPEVLFVP